tara:strand:+ start:668 stop:2305 length:1638 start_codon:yes stop_codon:yes gene_type:complete
MPLNAQAEISGKIQEALGAVKLKMPNGQIPHKEELADLKGILPNPKTCKNVLSCGTGVPSNFLSDFDPLTSLIAVIPIPKPKLSIKSPIIDVVDKVPEPLPEINTEGLTKKEIEELERKREAQQKLNELKTNAANKVKGAAAGLVNKIGAGIEGQIQGGIEGAVNNAKAGLIAGAMGAPGVKDIMMKIAAFKFFKAQMAAAGEKVKKVTEAAKKTMEEAKDPIKGSTESIAEDKNLKKEDTEKESAAASQESSADTMVPTTPGHPGPGNKADSKTTRKAAELRAKAEGFKKNLEQTVKNVGSFLTDVLGTVKKLLGTILKVVGALMAIIGLIAMLKQLMELMMMLMFSKCNGGTGGGANNSQAQSPEQFLNELQYPGFTQEDFSTALNNATNNTDLFNEAFNASNNPNSNINQTGIGTASDPNLSNKPVFTNEDLTNPIIMGGYQIGDPLTSTDLGPTSDKNFTTHPLMGDLTEIHPQIINDLYNDGVLPLPKDVKSPDPTQFEKELDELYDQIFEELVESENMEYIEKLYNLDFEMIGYKRYRA